MEEEREKIDGGGGCVREGLESGREEKGGE